MCALVTGVQTFALPISAVARVAWLRSVAPVLDVDVPYRAERCDLVPAQRRPPAPARGAARRGHPRHGRRQWPRPRNRGTAARAASLHRHPRAAQPCPAPALPRRAKHPRDRRGAGHLRKQCHHQDQPPQAANPRPRRGPRQRMTMEPTMELDELKHAWQSLDRQLQQQKRINLQLLADNRIAGAKRGLRWLQARSVMQVAIGVVLTVFFARFWTSHLGNLPLVLSGITLHAYSVALIIKLGRPSCRDKVGQYG